MSKIKRLYLHMGLHKTGTTFVQETLALNQKFLLNKYDIYYPIFKCSIHKTEYKNHSIPITTIVTTPTRKYGPLISMNSNQMEEYKNNIFLQMRYALENYNTIIISGEEISTLKLKELQKLKNFITDFGFVIKPIVFYRDPYEILCSSTQEISKHGINSEYVRVFSSISKVLNIKTVFPQTNFVSFNDNKDTVQYFLNILNISDTVIKSKYSNIGLPNDLVRFLICINNYQPKVINGKINNLYCNIIKKIISSNKIIKEFKNEKFLITKQEYLHIKHSLDNEYNFLQNEFGINTSTMFKKLSFSETKDLKMYLNHFPNFKQLISESYNIDCINFKYMDCQSIDIPFEFDYNIYHILNKDLENNRYFLKYHYINHGYRECRKYKFDNVQNDFNPKTYKSLTENKDLINLSDDEAYLHYENHGYKEGRKYK